MSFIILPSRRRGLSRPFFGINKSGRYAEGLSVLLSAAGAFRINQALPTDARGMGVRNATTWTPNSLSNGNMRYGPAIYYPDGGYSTWNQGRVNTSRMSVLWIGALAVAPDGAKVQSIAGQYDASSAPTYNTYDWLIYESVANNLSLLVSNGVNANAGVSSTALITVDTPLVMAGAFEPTQLRAYHKVGNARSFATAVPTFSALSSAHPLRMGRLSLGYTTGVRHNLLAVWSGRALSAGDLIDVAENPGQLFDDGGIRVFYSLPSGNITISLTGQSSTFSYGTLVPALSRALSGLSASFSRGTLIPALAKTLTGQSATFSGGTLTPVTGITVNLTGQSFTGSVGSLKAALAVNLLGQSVTASGGTITPSVGGNVSVNLSGISGTFSYGTLTAGQGLPPETMEFSWSGKKAKFSFKTRYMNFDLD